MSARAITAGFLMCLTMDIAVALPGAPLQPEFQGPIMRVQMAPSKTEEAHYQGLHDAVASGDLPELTRLIAKGADVNRRDARGRTALMVAVYRERRVAFIALVDAGADVDAFDADRYDVLTIAAVADDLWSVRRALTSGADPRAVTSPYEGTALIAAAHLGHVEVVRALIAAGAPLDHVNNLGWTALIEAIVLGDGEQPHVEVVKALVKAGADVNLADSSGTRPLSLAENAGYAKIAAILKAAGARR